MKHPKSYRHILLVPLILQICFAELPLMDPSSANQTLMAPIYQPGPSMLGLDQPMTSIRQTGPLRLPMYGNPNISAPAAYNHYNYLYSVYNYQRMAYPYLAYGGNGRRNPGYFNFNGSNSGDKTDEDKPRKREMKFNGARVLNVESLLADKMEGRFGSKQFLQLWVKAAGPLKPPPQIREGETAVYFNTPLDQKVRVISKVEPETEDDQTKRILVYYKLEQRDSKDTSFYNLTDEKFKAHMSVAIFAAEDKPVKPVLEESETPSDTENRENGVEILAQSKGVWPITSPADYVEHEGTNLTRNYVIKNASDLVNIAKYLRIPEDDMNKLLQTEWSKEVIYITGRLYPDEKKGKSDFDRIITSVLEWRSRWSTSVQHFVEIVEPTQARNTSVKLDNLDDPSLKTVVFCAHWVRVAIPRNFNGLKTFSIKASKD